MCAPTRRYILRDGDGTCEALVDGVGKVMTYKAGEFFGELALLTGGKRAATVVAAGPAGSRWCPPPAACHLPPATQPAILR